MIYFDMDGVLADFEKGVEQHYGEPFSKVNKNRFWNEVVKTHGIFEKLPPIRLGLELLGRVIEDTNDVCILTSTGGGTHHYNIATQKAAWLYKHVPNVPVIFCMGTQNKASFAKPGDLLIDDREKVCMAWEASGGDSLLFDPKEKPVNGRTTDWETKVLAYV